ncbi:hypothetical protein HELRODRAFT_195155 [Helobdella robusta]|uniref:Ion transport N-terminal domain-containing protein n=1 Tax=Helobdella robusta TaxID=6412 RepID=T1FWT6_HELRO|nr:hypothetical protein HELRODRAFT_195155 [Helobdella robusta]ESO05460.1 hypothetical protein HELRODRAFT_195155 [Helobdella robusta]
MSCFRVSESKSALKLFGNQRALKKEVQRQKRFGRWIIHPCSSFRLYWNIGETFLLIINLIVLPISITFFKDDLGSHWIAFNTISDTFFLVDLALNFRTGFFEKNSEEIVLDPIKIAKNYLKTFFVIDFISSFPIDYTILMFSANNSSTYTDTQTYKHKCIRSCLLICIETSKEISMWC